MKTERREAIIHCRLTKAEHAAIKDAATNAGMNLTPFVIKACQAMALAMAEKEKA